MRGFRALLVAFVAGLLPALYFWGWFKWPAFLAVGVGAMVGVVMLMVIASIGSNPASEETAWREAAPDLVRMPGAPGASERPEDPRRPDSEPGGPSESVEAP